MAPLTYLHSIRPVMVSAALAVALAATAWGEGRDFSGQDISGQTFQRLNLDGSDFTNADARHASFAGASLRRTIWLNANLKKAIVTSADFSDADLRGVTGPFIGDRIIFTGANLEGLDLGAFGCAGCEFGGADLRRTRNWGYLSEANFRKADLRGADLSTMTSATPSNLAWFIGAVYDDATIWPSWVERDKLRATKVASDGGGGQEPGAAQPAGGSDDKANAAPPAPELGAYECILQESVNAGIDDEPRKEPGGTNKGYPIIIGEPRPGMNFVLEPGGVYRDADLNPGTYEYGGGRLSFAGGILDGQAADVMVEDDHRFVLFAEYGVQCNHVADQEG